MSNVQKKVDNFSQISLKHIETDKQEQKVSLNPEKISQTPYMKRSFKQNSDLKSNSSQLKLKQNQKIGSYLA